MPKKTHAPGEAPADEATEVIPGPLKVSGVPTWLAAHPNVDPMSLALRGRPKAAIQAAAIRALALIGTAGALDAIATYRPEMVDGFPKSPGRCAGTWRDEVGRELAFAWSRFDRRTFARRMFAGLRTLDLGGVNADITGLDDCGLEQLRLGPLPSSDLSPLAGCRELTRLSLWVAGRTDGVAPLAQMPALGALELSASGDLSQVSIDALAESKTLRCLVVEVGPDIDVGSLARLPALRRLMLTSTGRRADPRMIEALERLIERGVGILVYGFEPWVPEVLAALPDRVAVARRENKVGLARDPKLAQDALNREVWLAIG